MATMKVRQLAYDTLKDVLTEERTDSIKDLLVDGIKSKLPRWMRWLPIGKVIDALLPEVLLSVLKDALDV